MTTKRKLWVFVARAGMIAVVAMLALAVSYPLLPTPVRAAIKLPPPFDFSDAFYTQNGIDINKIQNLGPDSRVGFSEPTRNGPEFGSNPALWNGQYNWIEDSSNTDATRGGTRGGIRVTQTTGGFDKDGNLIYYNIMAPVPDQTFFTPNAAGARAHDLANQFTAFIFPKQLKNGAIKTDLCDISVAPGSPAAADCVVQAPPPGNRRQDNLFETKDTYFCGNLLGLWLLKFVVFTPAAFNTPEGQQALADLSAKNGINLDGTPIITTLAQIESLHKAGFVQLPAPPDEPHPGAPRYVV